jgi:hypothetical protein
LSEPMRHSKPDIAVSSLPANVNAIPFTRVVVLFCIAELSEVLLLLTVVAELIKVSGGAMSERTEEGRDEEDADETVSLDIWEIVGDNND